jgi:hypothetical protein
MIDEIKAGERQAKGAKAYELLHSELLQETFGYLENEYLQSWRNSSVKDEKGRENLFLAVRILDHVRAHLNKLIIDGKIASKDLANIKYLKR